MYLQLGIQFGNIPYITDPIETVDDLATLQSYEKLSLSTLISTLIDEMVDIPFMDTFTDDELTSDDDSVFFINKYCLLGDLYLWDNQYTNAAIEYKTLMTLEGSSEYDKYKIIWSDVTDHDDLNFGYTRYLGDDV